MELVNRGYSCSQQFWNKNKINLIGDLYLKALHIACAQAYLYFWQVAIVVRALIRVLIHYLLLMQVYASA